MTWIHLPGSVHLNLSTFILYDIQSAKFTTPAGDTCPLEPGQCQTMLDFLDGNQNPAPRFSHVIKGLAYPNGSDGPWIRTIEGAVNMALVETIAVKEQGRIVIVWGGKVNRVYADDDAALICRWLDSFSQRSL